MVTWHAADYLKFSSHRLRPAVDLLHRIPDSDGGVRRVVDLGCGAGNVTLLLRDRWRDAALTGVDASPEMLDRARADGLDVTWVQADIAAWEPDDGGAVDVLFSNAALHWLDDHERLLPRLAGFVAPGGVLAVQMPANFTAPSHTCIAEAIAAGPWRESLWPLMRHEPIRPMEDYYDLLALRAASLDVWETTYVHILEGDNPVLEWTRGTALRPYLDRLDGAWRDAFLADYAARISRAYPRRADGKTLFAFRRLFIVARM